MIGKNFIGNKPTKEEVEKYLAVIDKKIDYHKNQEHHYRKVKWRLNKLIQEE